MNRRSFLMNAAAALMAAPVAVEYGGFLPEPVELVEIELGYSMTTYYPNPIFGSTAYDKSLMQALWELKDDDCKLNASLSWQR